MKTTKWTKVLSLILAVLMMVAVLAACAPKADEPATDDPATDKPADSKPSDEPADEPSGDVKTLTIGVSDSMTGTGAAYGLPGYQAVELAASQLNAEGGIKIGDDTYKVEIVAYDNKSDANEAVSTITKLLDVDKVNYVLGWSNSTSANAAIQAAGDRDVTFVVGNARAPQLQTYNTRGNVFRSCTANCYDPVADCQFIKDQGVSKVAILAMYNDTGYSVHVENVTNAFKKIGVDVVAEVNFGVGETDFLAQMTQIVNSGAEAIYSAGNIEESALALRQLRELGSDMLYCTFSSGTGPQWLEVCTTEQMHGAYTIRPQVADPGCEEDADDIAFVEAYTEMYDILPSQTATNTYDNFWILMAAMQKAGTTEWAAVNEAFWDLTFEDLDERVILEYTETDGKLFDKYGQSYHAYSVLKWDDEAGDWAYHATIGQDIGCDFYNAWLENAFAEAGTKPWFEN